MQAPATRLAAPGLHGQVVWLRRAVVMVFLVLLALSVDDGHRLDVAAPTAPPQWTARDAAAFRQCRPMAAWPHHQIPTSLVVQRVADEGHSLRMPFDRAWAINHDRTEVDDVYVLGACS
jgi:hypothetical protein